MHIQINPRSLLNLEHICEVLYKHSNEDKKQIFTYHTIVPKMGMVGYYFLFKLNRKLIKV